MAPFGILSTFSMSPTSDPLGQLLDSLSDPALVVARDDRVELANSFALDLLGYEAHELRGLAVGSLFAEGAPESLLHPCRTAPAQPTPSLGWSLRRRDGKRIPAEIVCIPLLVEDGSGVLVLVRGVTERKRVEDDVRKSEERLRQAVRVAQIGIFDHDHRPDTHYWSPRQREIYGWGESEVVTLPGFLAVVHPDDRDAIASAVRRAHDSAGEGKFDVEHRIIRRDGEVRWVQTRSVTFFAEESDRPGPVRTVGAVVDVTERKMAEEALEGRDRLAAILDATPDLVAIAEPHGNLLYLNLSARRFLGIGSGDDISKRALSDGHPDPARRLLTEIAIPTAVHDGVWKGETSYQRANGQELPVSLLVLAHGRADGRVAFLSTIARDLSKEKNLEAQFLQAQKMEAIGRMAGGVAHDFNNILSVILSYASLAAAGLPEGHPSRDDLEEVRSSAERAAALTRQMLAFSRKQVLQPRVIDTNAVLDGMAPMMRRLIGEDIELVVALAPVACHIRADPRHLEQAILNLVANARDAMPKGGKLVLETRASVLDEDFARSHVDVRPGPHAIISVADTGVGMDVATRTRIFEPFFTTKGPGQGTGLGLSTVFGIVKQSGGSIWVHSEAARGTTFTMCFPRTDEPVRVEAPGPGPLVSATEATVLVVEDEPQVRKLVVSVLHRAGYRVLEAGGPMEALELARGRAGKLDLLLTDVVMPQMNGKQLAEALATMHPETRVLYMSGYTRDTIAHQGVLDKGVNFLPKPITPDALLKAVPRVLNMPRG